MKGVIAVFVGVLFVISMISYAAVADDTNTTAAEKYNELKQKYSDAKNAYEHARSEFLAAKDAYLKLRSIKNKTNITDNARIFLTKTLDRMIAHLELIKTKVENMKPLDETERSEIIADISGYITYFESKKTEVSTATTMEQLRIISQDIKSKWLEARKGIRRALGLVLNAGIKALLDKGENFSARIQARIDALKARGVDTAALESMLSDFKSHLALAKENYDAAKQKLGTNPADENTLKEAHIVIKEAHKHLIEAHKVLRDIASEMKKSVYALRASNRTQNTT